MKITYVLLGAAFLLMTGIMLSLLKSGGALRPVGVIKPTEYSTDIDYIGKSVALRMFPEFHASDNVIWYLDHQDESFVQILQSAYAHHQSSNKQPLRDLRQSLELCQGKCWYVQQLGNSLPENLIQEMKNKKNIEIFIQDFNRNETVPAECENQKIMEYKCIKPVSIREVRRKIKSSAPHFFMRRYQDSQFYLYIEK